jgi:hypothetical protein
VTNKLNERRNDQWSLKLETIDREDQSLWNLTRQVMSNSTPQPPLFSPGGLVLSDSEKAETLADSLEALFQPINDPLVPAGIDVVNETMRTYSLAPASEPKLTSLMVVQDAMWV